MFPVTVSINISFITATVLFNRKKSTIFGAIQQTLKLYKGNDLKSMNQEEGQAVHTILADNEFQVLQDEIEEMGINVHIVTKNDHVPEVERPNRVIKERVRAIIQTIPYKRLAKKILIALIQYIVFWLNNIPKEGQVQSP